MPGLPESSLPETLVAPGEAAAVYADWSDLVSRIRSREGQAIEELYLLFWKGIRDHLFRQLGQAELNDRLDETFWALVRAIDDCELHESQRLVGFVRNVVQRQVAKYVTKAGP